MPKKTWKDFSSPDLPYEHIGYQLGHVPWADSVMHDLKTENGDTVYNAYYSIDALNKRITPHHDSSKNKFAVFFGCSVCYGLGLEDNQTLPYYFQEKSGSFNAYNYAFSGWGMHHMLARLEHKNLAEEVSEKDGIGVYVFLWSHIRRAIGDMRIYTSWGHTMPYYSMKNGELERNGNFANGRIFTSWLYEILHKSYIASYYNVNLPLEIDEDDYVLAAEIIKKAKQKYMEQFGNDKFYVLIHPIDWEEFTLERKNKFIQHLTERNINYLDYANAVKLDNEHILVGDGHPNALTYQEISALLISDLIPDITNDK